MRSIADSLHHQAAEKLRQQIFAGELAPGSFVDEAALCEQLAVSRTPLREAFRLLAADGLVDLEPNRGARVVALSERDIRELFEVMGALEALAGELASSRIADADVAELKALTFEMLACHARSDLPAYYRINRAIHDRIALAAGNEMLRRTYETLNRRIQNLRFRSNFDRAKWDLAAREHVRMVELLERRDAAGLAALLRGHLARKCDAVLEVLAREGAAR